MSTAASADTSEPDHPSEVLNSEAAAPLKALRVRVLEENARLSGLLRLCLAVGAATGSDRLRTWARQELNGYSLDDDLPSYRRLPLLLRRDMLVGTWQLTNQSITPHHVPKDLRHFVPDTADFRQPIDALEREAASTSATLTYGNHGFAALATRWTAQLPAFQRVTAVYFTATPSTLAGLVGHIRTNLVELVADMTQDLPFDSLPEKEKVDSVVTQHIHGDYTSYVTSMKSNNGVVGQGASVTQTQNNGVLADELVDLTQAVRNALGHDGIADEDREQVEHAIDDLEDAVRAADPIKVKRCRQIPSVDYGEGRNMSRPVRQFLTRI